MTRLSESGLLASAILRRWTEKSGVERPAAVVPASGRDTWEEERLEIVDAVLEEMRRAEPGRDRLAACRYLLSSVASSPRRTLTAG